MIDNTFWDDPDHCLIRDMLVAVDFNNARTVEGWATRGYPWHRAVYLNAASLIEATCVNRGYGRTSQGLAGTRTDAMGILVPGLSWAIIRFGQPVDSVALTQAIVYRIRKAQKNFPSQVSLDYFETHADRLMASAGNGLFNFDAFLHVAHYLGMGEISQLHRVFMGARE